ncbi:MAG: excisionase [Eubacterium sp.]
MKKQEYQKEIIPVWERYVLTITEASNYYHIGENKLRMIAEEHIKEDFIIMNGNRVLFKRQKFEKFLDNATVV